MQIVRIGVLSVSSAILDRNGWEQEGRTARYTSTKTILADHMEIPESIKTGLSALSALRYVGRMNFHYKTPGATLCAKIVDT